jgi:hypothetical protein
MYAQAPIAVGARLELVAYLSCPKSVGNGDLGLEPHQLNGVYASGSDVWIYGFDGTLLKYQP